MTAPSFGTPAPAVHSLDHIVVGVPDLDEARTFFEAFGLIVEARADALKLGCRGNDHRWVSLVAAPAKKLQEIVFGAFAEDMPGMRTRLETAGVPELRLRNDGSLAFVDLDGTPVRVVAAEKSSPGAKSAPSSSHGVAAAGTAAAPPRRHADTVHPRRLAHILFFTRDVMATVAFYTRALGLRLSDEAGGSVAFLHGVHGSDHHMIAFDRADGPGLHHTSWDVGSVDEVGRGTMQMAAAGYREGWGLGRHVLGSNYFHYVRDPWGSYAEYSFDIDFIPAGFDWREGHHLPEDSYYLWAPPPPGDFGVNYESRVAGSPPPERKKENIWPSI